MVAIPARSAHVIHRARFDELPQVIDTLAAAFFDDPVARWIIPDDSRRFALMKGFFEIGVEKLWWQHQRIYTVKNGAAAAVLVPPGRTELSEEEAAEVMPPLDALLGDRMPALVELMTVMDEQAPQRPHYHLAFIGTQPGQQGQGFGAALLAHTLAEIDDEGIPVYLEATGTRNRALYERHGFEFIDMLDVPNGPSMHRMWREPR